MAGAVSFGDVQLVLDAAIGRAAGRYCLRGSEAEDFAQDVRVEVLRRDQAALRRFRGEGEFTYFYRIAARVAVDRIRHERGRAQSTRHPETTAGALRRRDWIKEHPERRCVQPAIDGAALCEHVTFGLARVLAVLEDDERALLVRRFCGGDSANDLGRATGRSRSAVARRLGALLAELRDMLVLVSVSRGDVTQVLAECRIDAALLDEPGALPDPTRPLRVFCASSPHGPVVTTSC